MLKEALPRTKKVFSQYCFSHPLTLVWQILTNSSLISFLQPKNQNFQNFNISYQPHSIHYEIGSKFQVQLCLQIYLNIEIENIIETDYFCQIKWKGSINNILLLHFHCMFEFYSIEENKTLFLCRYLIKYLNKESSQLLQFNEENNRHKYYLYISKFITTKQYLLFNIEEITVKGLFSFVKKIVSSTRTVFELIGDIKYSSDREIKEGTNFIIEINKIENLAKNVVASVKIIQIAEMKNTVRFKCFVKDITKSLPNRIVTFDIYKNDNHNITIIYIHKFDRPVEGRTLQVFRTIKKFLLDQLAMIIETNYYKQDYNAFYKE